MSFTCSTYIKSQDILKNVMRNFKQSAVSLNRKTLIIVGVRVGRCGSIEVLEDIYHFSLQSVITKLYLALLGIDEAREQLSFRHTYTLYLLSNKGDIYDLITPETSPKGQESREFASLLSLDSSQEREKRESEEKRKER